MRKRTLLAVPAALLFFGVSAGSPAQTGPDAARPRPDIGTVDIVAGHVVSTPSAAHFTGHVRLTSASYDLAAETITLYSAPKSRAAGAGGLLRATAEGDAGAGTQVTAHIRRPLESEDYQIFADHAVYLPVRARPGGGRLDFTGHVRVVTKSGFLAGPSDATTDRATVLLGSGADYPQVETGATHILFTPAQ